jgi:hypothetical protein
MEDAERFRLLGKYRTPDSASVSACAVTSAAGSSTLETQSAQSLL